MSRDAGMYGWRARIAFLSPSRGEALVYEFYQLAPQGVLLMNSTGTVRTLGDADLAKQMQLLEERALDVVPEAPDLIIAGGSPIVTMQGYGAEARIAARLTEVTGVPCMLGIQAEVESLRAVGSQRPVLASPYPHELDERLIRYLGDAGFDVQGCKGLGIAKNAEIGKLPPAAALRCAREAYASAPHADAIFIPCARWPTLDAVDQLEQDLGVPVVSATTAVFYGAFARLNIRDPFTRGGALLKSLAPKSVQLGAAYTSGVVTAVLA